MKIVSQLALILVLVSTSVEARIFKGYSTSSVLKTKGVTFEELNWVNLALSPLGVTGANGPLGSLGPFGNNFWNATAAFHVVGNWEDFAKALKAMNGPLSKHGPVFLTTELGKAMMSFTGSAHLLAPGGVLHSVGNAGPLGPLGIAGMLGPNGAHGYTRNDKGDFVSKQRKIVKSIKIESHEGEKSFDLYELYRLEKFDLSKIQDTSFALRGVINKSEQVSLKVKSKVKQWVNVLVVNEYSLDAFHLKVEDESGNWVSSSENMLSNFVSIKVERGTLLKITLTHAQTGHIYKKPFRLFVTGSEGVTEIERPFHIQ